MDDALLQALAVEVGRMLAALRAEMRRERAAEVAEIRRGYEADAAALRERLSETSHALELVRAEHAALLATANDPVAALTLDAAGTLQLVQRSGPARSIALPDVPALVRDAVQALEATLREALQAEAQALVARSAELYFNPPAWSAATVYGAGEIVATDIGRTYRVRSGVRAAVGREPGEDPEKWERLGTGGFRVFKSKPTTLQPGDMFAEHDARFVHDGQTTTLLVPKVPKTSDLERVGKASHGLAQVAIDRLQGLGATVVTHGEEIARNAAAANDASEASVQALAATEELRSDLEAMRGVVQQLQTSGGGTP